MKMQWYCTLAIFVVSIVHTMNSPVVKISDGQLKGRLLTDYDGNSIYAFLGIPYAQPAFGELRFKAPLPVESWDGIKDATKDGDKCIQRVFSPEVAIEGSENCIHLNVFTKQLSTQNSTDLKPVMVWFHGGGFFYWSGNSDMFGPGYLLTENVVLVTVNYRLGILGFLKLQDPSLEVYGNAGLKDQQLALKWVQKNIRAFGGDPNNVTIFGESAGGASVHFHILSPSSKGLFHKAILQSGVALNRWAQEPTEPVSLVEFVKHVGQNASNEKEAVTILRSVSVERLYAAQEAYTAEKITSGRIFVPGVEIPNETAFITNKPIELISSGTYNDVPMMMGYNSAETMYFLIEQKVKESKGVKYHERYSNIEEVLPKDLRKKATAETVHKLCEKIRKFYEKYDNKIPMLSDAHFVAAIVRAAKLHARDSKKPVYFYRMNLNDELNFYRKTGPPLNLPGMSHADDLGYLFTMKDMPLATRGSSAEIAMKRIVKLWTNFARDGIPTPNETEFGLLWQPMSKESFNFLEIGPQLEDLKDPDSERMKLWEEIMELTTN